MIQASGLRRSPLTSVSKLIGSVSDMVSCILDEVRKLYVTFCCGLHFSLESRHMFQGSHHWVDMKGKGPAVASDDVSHAPAPLRPKITVKLVIFPHIEVSCLSRSFVRAHKECDP